MPRRLLLISSAVALMCASAGDLPGQERSGAIAGVIVGRESGVPLPHTMVTLPGLRREGFTNESGSFLFTHLPAGRTVLRVRRLGYAPMDVSIQVRAGVTDTVRVQVGRVAVRLASVDVRERQPCLQPGAPRASVDSTLATIYSQMLLNAEQYKLLSRQHPFAYSLASIRSHRRKDGRIQITEIDTTRVVSEWKYQPGQVTRLDRLGSDRGMLMLLIPTLGNFGDPDFIDNHCFHNGGSVTVDGAKYIRVDLVAAERIVTPDVSGSIMLDPETFQIRRSVLRLSRLPDVPGMTAAEVTTEFRELLPSIPVIARITSSQTFDARKRGVRYAMGLEELHMVDFTWLGEKPGQEKP